MNIAFRVKRYAFNVMSAMCSPSPLADCMENVMTQQCGAEIAGQLRELGTKITTAFGCESRKRQ